MPALDAPALVAGQDADANAMAVLPYRTPSSPMDASGLHI